MSGIPVTITNAGMPVTPGMGAPVTLVGGTAAVISDDQTITVSIDGVTKDATFTVVNGAITAITTV